MTNMAIGTPDFVAPESLEMGRTVDHRADLYAVGVMFYQMLTGALPRGNFRPPSGRVEGLDPRLDAVVAKAMESDPEDRYADAASFRAAIDEILSSPVPEAEETTGPVTPSGRKLNLGPVSTPGKEDSPDALPEAGTEREKTGLPPVLWVSLAVLLVLSVVAVLVLRNGDNDEAAAVQTETLASSEPVTSIEAPDPDLPENREPTTPPSTEMPAANPPKPSEPEAKPETPPMSPAFSPVDLLAEIDRELLGENRIDENTLVATANAPIVFDLPESIRYGEGFTLELIVQAAQANGFRLSLP